MKLLRVVPFLLAAWSVGSVHSAATQSPGHLDDHETTDDIDSLQNSQNDRILNQTPMPIMWNDQVVIAYSSNSGDTSNCGMYGCRVASYQNAGPHIRFGHGGTSPAGFYFRYQAPSETMQRSNECIQWDDYVVIAHTSELSHEACGSYGCRVMGKMHGEQLGFGHGHTITDGNLFQIRKPSGSSYQDGCVAYGDRAIFVNKSTGKAIKYSSRYLYADTISAGTQFYLRPKTYSAVLEVPDVSESDTTKVMEWIKLQTTREKTPFCWRDSYGRGVGVIPTSCPSGKEKIGALCYSQSRRCPSGTVRFRFDCYSVCPKGMTDDGLFCRLEHYERAGYTWQLGDVPFSSDGMLQRCFTKHGSCELWGAIAYPKCKSGYRRAGCCQCEPIPPNCKKLGLADGGVFSCAKHVTIMRATPLTCSSNTEYDAGLCYERCKFGFGGVGPVCWSDCGGGQVDCGAGCGRSTEECALETVGQALGPLILVANVASLGLATPLTNGLQTITVAGNVVAGNSKVGKAFVKFVKEMQTADFSGTATSTTTVLRKEFDRNTGKELNKRLHQIEMRQEAFEGLEEYKKRFAENFAEQTSPDINAAIDGEFSSKTAQFMKEQWALVEMEFMAEAEQWVTVGTALLVASAFDPAGVLTDLVGAYAKSSCLVNEKFPQI